MQLTSERSLFPGRAAAAAACCQRRIGCESGVNQVLIGCESGVNRVFNQVSMTEASAASPASATAAWWASEHRIPVAVDPIADLHLIYT